MFNVGLNAGVSMNTLKSRILNPAFTSVYSVLLSSPNALGGEGRPGLDRDLFELTCIEASLPGSSIATVETNRDFHGIVEKHAYSRLYDESIELTFLVTLDSNYLQIRYFDYWMKFIVGEDTYTDSQLANKVHQRAKYPDDYKGGMKIVKFEKDLGSGNSFGTNAMVYNFVDVFPKSINSVPVTYEASQLLKVTVSLSYTRYFIDQTLGQTDDVFASRIYSSTAPGIPEIPFLTGIDSNFSGTGAGYATALQAEFSSAELYNTYQPFSTDFNFDF